MMADDAGCWLVVRGDEELKNVSNLPTISAWVASNFDKPHERQIFSHMLSWLAAVHDNTTRIY
jgi:hypothetical protein